LQNNGAGDALQVYVDNFIVSPNPKDTSGNNNVGTLKNGVTSLINSGKFPYTNTLNFNGYNGYVTTVIPALKQPLFDSQFTVEFWAKLNAQPASSAQSVFVSQLTSTGGQQVLYDSYGNIIGSFRTSTGSEYMSLINSPLSNNQWYHIAFTYQDDGTSAATKLYLDGQLRDTDNHANKIKGSAANSLFFIGSNKDGAYIGYPGTRELNGTIDELNIYNRVLTDQEILNRYNSNTRCTDYS